MAASTPCWQNGGLENKRQPVYRECADTDLSTFHQGRPRLCIDLSKPQIASPVKILEPRSTVSTFTQPACNNSPSSHILCTLNDVLPLKISERFVASAGITPVAIVETSQVQSAYLEAMGEVASCICEQIDEEPDGWVEKASRLSAWKTPAMMSEITGDGGGVGQGGRGGPGGGLGLAMLAFDLYGFDPCAMVRDESKGSMFSCPGMYWTRTLAFPHRNIVMTQGHTTTAIESVKEGQSGDEEERQGTNSRCAEMLPVRIIQRALD